MDDEYLNTFGTERNHSYPLFMFGPYQWCHAVYKIIFSGNIITTVPRISYVYLISTAWDGPLVRLTQTVHHTGAVQTYTGTVSLWATRWLLVVMISTLKRVHRKWIILRITANRESVHWSRHWDKSLNLSNWVQALPVSHNSPAPGCCSAANPVERAPCGSGFHSKISIHLFI